MKTKSSNRTLRLIRGAGMFCLATLLSGTFVGCSFEDDLATLQEQVNGLEQKVAAITEQVTAFDKFLKENVTINKVTFDEEKGIYNILLSDNTSIQVASSAVASMPKIGIEQDENGAYYWTLDGEPIMTPSGDKLYSAPSLRVNSSTGFWEISADGGATYISTGIKAGDNASIIAKVDEDDAFVYFTLADGSTLKVAKTVDFRINILAGKQYFDNAQTRKIGLDMSGVKKHAVYSKPDGWKAVIEGDKLSITAPAKGNANADKKGSVIVQAWFNDGTSDISEVAVVLGTAPHEILVNSDFTFEISIDPSFLDRWDLTGSTFGVVSYNGFSEEKLLNQIKEDTRTPWLWPDEFPKKSSIAKVIGSEPVKGESYVIYVVDNWNDGKEYEMLYTVVSIPDLKVEISDVTFEDARISITPKGISKYYAGVGTKDFDLSYILEGINYYNEGTLVTGPYNGSLNKFALAPGTKDNGLFQGMTYVVYIIPYVEGKIYKEEDVIIKEVVMQKLVFGGTASAKIGEVTSTMTSVSSTITKEPGTYKYWVKYFSAEQLSKLPSDEAIFGELSNDKLIADDTYEYTAKKLVAGSKGWIITLACDKDGKLGKVNRVEANTSDLTFSTIQLPEPELVVGLNSATVKFPAIEGIKRYKYISEQTTTWNQSFLFKGDVDKTEKLLAMAETQTQDYKFIDAAADGSVVIELTEKKIGTPYVLFVMGVDEAGVPTKMKRLDYTPDISKFISKTNEAYRSITYSSIVMDGKDIKEWTVKDYEYVDPTSGFHNISIKLEPSADCKAMWVYFGEQSMISTVGRVGTGQILSDYNTVKCTPDNPEATFEYFYNSAQILVVWQDNEDNYYEYIIIDPKTLLKDYVAPEQQ